MLEVILILLVLGVNAYVGELWFSAFTLVLLLVLVLPGLYSFMFGAPYVRTDKKKVQAIVGLIGQNAGRVAELGCGDGRIIRKIAGEGALEACGYEFSVPTFLVAKFINFVSRGKARIYFKNFWKEDYSEFDVLVVFLNDNSMKRFKEEIWPTLKRGAKLVSNEFELPGVKYADVSGRVWVYIKK